MRRRFIIIVAVGVVAIMLAVIAAWMPYSGQRLSRADRAEERLRATLTANPQNVAARVELADRLWDARRRPESLMVLQEGLKLDTKNETLLRALAQRYSDWAGENGSTPKYAKAAACYQVLTQGGCSDVTVYRKLVYFLRRSEQYGEAISTAKKALDEYPGDAVLTANLGAALKLSGKYEEALPLLEKLTRREPNYYSGWYWLAFTQRVLGRYSDAATSFRRAWDLSPPDERDDLAYSVESIQVLSAQERSEEAVDAHCCLGEEAWEEHRTDRAIAEYKAAIDLRPGTSEDNLFLSQYTLRISQFYSAVNDYDQALEYALLAERHAKEIGDHHELVYVYQRLCSLYGFRAGNAKEGNNEFLKKALRAAELQREYAEETNDDHLAKHALAAQAESMVAMYGIQDERVRQIRKDLVSHIPQQGPVHDCAIEAIVRTEARMRARENDVAGARLLFELTIPDRPSTDVISLQGNAGLYNYLAWATRTQNDYDACVRYAEKAVEQWSVLRDTLGSDEFRRQCGGAMWFNTYSAFLYCASKQGDSIAAFNRSEEYKARALLDLLGGKADKQNPDDALQLALADVSRIEEQLRGTPDQNVPTDEVSPAPSASRDLAFEETLHKRLPEDRRVARRMVASYRNADTLRLENLKDLFESITFVTYCVSDDVYFATVASSDGAHMALSEDTDTPILRELVEQFRQGLGIQSSLQRDLQVESGAGRGATDQTKETALEESRRLLYERLIEPVLPYIKTKMVCISPDGVLNYLPFEVLGKDGKYLVEDYAISYAPSANVLKLCLDKQRNRRESVLALGNPNLQNPAFRLANAEDEVNALKSLLPRADVFTFDQATEKVVKEQARDYDILHFACHGELNQDDPMLTSLRLAPDAENDGYLHAGEVFDLDLNASLVVLSACNSALGDLAVGNELMGLTRSFLYAGTPSIIASLWTVDDRSTAMLMKAFYRNLATMSKAEALRQAKLETMKEYPNPFHWAAFCLQGDYR